MIDWSQVITAEDKIRQQEEMCRAERDRRLAESDWSQMPDSPMLHDDEWLDYRQALRDITEQNGFPNAVEWPVKPDKEVKRE